MIISPKLPKTAKYKNLFTLYYLTMLIHILHYYKLIY